MKWFSGAAPESEQEKMLKDIEEHYHNNDGFVIAKECREEMSLDPFTFIYGEVCADSMYHLMNEAQPKDGGIFYDLGAGSGKGIVVAGLFFPQIKSVGIEYLERMQQFSINMYEDLLQKLEIEEKPSNVELKQADMHEHDLSDADIIYVNATAYFDEALDNLVNTLNKLTKGTRVIITSKRLPEETFELVKHFPAVPMSWGDCQINLFEKK